MKRKGIITTNIGTCNIFNIGTIQTLHTMQFAFLYNESHSVQTLISFSTFRMSIPIPANSFTGFLILKKEKRVNSLQRSQIMSLPVPVRLQKKHIFEL